MFNYNIGQGKFYPRRKAIHDHNLKIWSCFKKQIPNHYFWRTDQDRLAICSSALYSRRGSW